MSGFLKDIPAEMTGVTSDIANAVTTDVDSASALTL